MIGRVLGHYRIVKQVGAGGMGEVYLAHDERLERDVALKVLRAGTLAEAAARRRFRKEALALSRLSHPNIETVHEFDTQEDCDFLVMEYVPGTTLSDKLAQGPLPERELISLAGQLVEGLAAAHEHGVVHLDVKPGNLRVTPDGRLKILDFGLARLLEPAGLATTATGCLTETQALTGTLLYMAPEQLRGEKTDHRADIWAAGVVLYEMATGRRPFAAKVATAVAGDILTVAPTAPSRVRSTVSPGLEHIILKCLEKDPDLRYQSARELLADFRRLGAAASGKEVGSMPPAKRAPGLGPERRWRRLAVWISIALLVLVGASLVRLLVTRGREAGPAAVTQPAIASLAVLPLANVSGRPDHDYVAAALHEALITELSKIGALRVISRTSTIRYEGGDSPLPQIGKELGVDAVVEGSVLMSGSRLRVSAQLVQVDPERHLWAESFDRDFTDVLYLTSDLAQAVARQVQVTLTPTEKVHLASARRMNPEAYALYAVGRHYQGQRTLEGYRRAIESLRRALELEPAYAPAYTALGDAYMLLGEQGGLPQEDARSLAGDAIHKALELDSDLAEAHTSLGQWRFYYEWNWAGAERAFQRAIELNPGHVAAHQHYGRALGFLGRFEDGLRELQRARELDPLSALVLAYIGQAFIHSGQYDRAADHLEWTSDLNPNHALVRHNLGEAYLALGRFAEAIEQLTRSVELTREPSAHYVAMLGCAYARGQRREDALAILGDLTERSKQGRVSAFDMASLHGALGDEASALTWLDRGSAQRDVWLAEIQGWPWFESLVPDARFQALLRRMEFPKEGADDSSAYGEGPRSQDPRGGIGEDRG